jgi:Protein of unknown function (DUF429)
VTPLRFETVLGVDFSGARLAGKTAWMSEISVDRDRLTLRSLANLETRSKSAERGHVMRWLVGAIGDSKHALWGIDAPFGLPVELFGKRQNWRAQLDFVSTWKGDAITWGRHLAQRSLAEFGVMHVRRETDRVMRTPFDCYHYRIVHQTFHAMRDVLLPLTHQRTTAVIPFDYARLEGAERVVIEACPSSTLLRLGLPRRGYKQPEGGKITPDRRKVRKRILEELSRHVTLEASHVQVMVNDPGGDAMDSVLAAVGAFESFANTDHTTLANDRRAVREGWVFG